jgi:predicted mannosyl-3-phosphoglycerate phosphatase (HAD superfamily)
LTFDEHVDAINWALNLPKHHPEIRDPVIISAGAGDSLIPLFEKMLTS